MIKTVWLFVWTWLILIQRCTACNFAAGKTSHFIHRLWTVNIRNNAADGRKSTTECFFFFFFTLTAQKLFMTFFVGCLFWLSVQHEAPSSVITTRMTSLGASWTLWRRVAAGHHGELVACLLDKITLKQLNYTFFTVCFNVARRVIRSFVSTLSPLLRSAVG